MQSTRSPRSVHTERPYSKVPGLEPIPGYRLLEPLGIGGFGEVWLCEAPGGLQKAIKFVPEDGSQGQSLRQEYEAFQTIKAIRHPFLLMLERVEMIGSDLVMVMELADTHMQERFESCRASGLPGIPRVELLGYLIDAAEALDHINHKYGLQHLDVKPANLFVVSNHVKVGDYGLVCRLPAGGAGGANPLLQRGLTPRYVAPEVLRGQIHPRSDQYSLALVYYELLTGQFPYAARSAQQMMLAHVSSKPDLSAIPELEQPIVLKALSKKPDDRFASCLAFVHGLIAVPEWTEPAQQNPSRDRSEQDTLEMPSSSKTVPPGWRPVASGHTIPVPAAEPLPALRTVQRGQPPAAAPLGPHRPGQTFLGQRSEPIISIIPEEEPVQLTTAGKVVRLPGIRSVVPLATLLGSDAPPATLWADQLIDAVITHAAAGGNPPKLPGEVGRRSDGTWVCRFPTTMLVSIGRLKCEPMREQQWFDEITEPQNNMFSLRQFAQSTGMWNRLSGKKGGLEILVRWMTGRVGEVELLGTLFGTPDAQFAREATEALPTLMAEVRNHLQNVEDRRKTPRLPTTLAVEFYPIADDGTVLPMLPARCRDISAGGLCVSMAQQPPERYAFATFNGCGVAHGMAILVKFLRTQPVGYEQLVSAKFRTDL